MKIRELRFKNLNSLYGEWVIDFTNPEYESNGIFALTGPTGAGKSTILDAICLALYGATPRLGKITKSGNEIMSRQTGECYAEVLFESQAGLFRCHWEQRRARKMTEGKLQDQEHQIVDGHTGKPLETKKSLVGDIIEEKTGMDFDRFTRSILLAQGGFDTFLKANAEQKSKILEQITGTEIYSEISRRVHERQRDAREKLNILNAENSGITILEPEQEKEVQDHLAAKLKTETERSEKKNQVDKAVAWLTAIDTLEKEMLSLTDEAAQLEAENGAFKPERTKLEQATKAASLDGTYATLTSLRAQQDDDQVNLKKYEAALPKLELLASAQAEALTAAELKTLKAKEELKAAAPVIERVRWLDQKLAAQIKLVSENTHACDQEAKKIEAVTQARVTEQEKQAAAEKTRAAAEHYLKAHAPDEWLISGLAGVETQFSHLMSQQQQITQRETDLKKAVTAVTDATKKLEEAAKQCARQEKERESAAKKLQQGKDALSQLLGDRLLREYRTEKETLLRETAFIKKIEELEDHRAKLEDGKPCPLCGATDHPFAEGNRPVHDETELKIASLTKLIDSAEQQETVIKDLEQAETTARERLNDSEKVEAEAIHHKKAAEKTQMELKEALTKLGADFEQLKRGVFEKLQPLGMGEIPESGLATLLEALQLRLTAWQKQTQIKTDIEKQIADASSEVKRLNALIEMQINALTEKQRHLERLKLELAEATEERKQLYGDKNPDDEVHQLNDAIADAEKTEKQARDQNNIQQQKCAAAKADVASLKKRIETRAPELKTMEADFLRALTALGFADEKAFGEARLSPEDREFLSARARELDNAGTELKARQQDRKARLKMERDQKLTDQTLEELEPQSKDLETALNELRETISGLKHTLRENTTAKDRVKEKQSAIAAQKIECQRWERLHVLIGSADGKKYRNFAQGLTFELMVSHANRQLTKMTDRYLLMRDASEPLELNVVDNYQAGEVRSTQNLSGGESFIVSLALALGLSQMASRKVRVDSLFLDEGFGTLDAEALETALETLSHLQQEGKLIGIISHVSALKEKMSTQISVTPLAGGRSTLSGPGCRKGAERK